MIVFPHAKINLGLRVLRRRGDGYHDLESVFYPVQFSDILEILPAGPNLNDGKPEIYVSGLPVPASSDNLCWKAAKLLQERHGLPSVRIHLHKKIPAGSGLGGGSSDAAFTLMAMNKIFDCGFSEDILKKYASEIGSDCSFFIRAEPSFVNGRGNILEPVSLSLAGYYLVLVLPGISISTAEAYQDVKPTEEGFSLREIIQLKPAEWKDKIRNMFEEVIFPGHPELKRIKDDLYLSGALYASMTGSGSAIYGIFSEQPVLKDSLKKQSTYTEKLV
jgi:4-diphosphocytidyl-2-C-methyl-D-erythritol kinase